jgi:hypothetical protein
VTVKQKSSTSTSVFIRTQRRFPTPTAHHDKWPTHATKLDDVDTDQCASGNWVAFLIFDLKDGRTFVYPYGLAPDQLSANQLIFPPPSPGGTYDPAYSFGEWYNRNVRPNLMDKIAGADFGPWLASH